MPRKCDALSCVIDHKFACLVVWGTSTQASKRSRAASSRGRHQKLTAPAAWQRNQAFTTNFTRRPRRVHQQHAQRDAGNPRLCPLPCALLCVPLSARINCLNKSKGGWARVSPAEDSPNVDVEVARSRSMARSLLLSALLARPLRWACCSPPTTSVVHRHCGFWCHAPARRSFKKSSKKFVNGRVNNTLHFIVEAPSTEPLSPSPSC